MFTPSVAVFAQTSDLQPQAQSLANRLSLPLADKSTDPYEYLLVLNANYLGLQKTNVKARPLFIDFLDKKIQHRRKQASLRKEMLARALGLKNKSPRKIIDATAGLARDSFILAALGFEVTALERSPIIFALLEDAIQRANYDHETGQILNRLHLIQANAIEWLRHPQTAEIIYLDPMFPTSKKSALSKQDMRIFHDVLGNDLDANLLLSAALACASERVVVKRPRLAPPIEGITPTFSIAGSSNRFDIYLTRDSHGNNTSAT